jgi:hypothetical protein
MSSSVSVPPRSSRAARDSVVMRLRLDVVYSCGSMLNGRDLILPYGMSDGAVGIAVVSVPDLLTALRAGH